MSSSDSGSKVYTSSSKYEVESAEWSNDREVGIGDTPKITVYLDPNTSSSSAYEYRFRSSYSASSVSISGGIFVSEGPMTRLRMRSGAAAGAGPDGKKQIIHPDIMMYICTEGLPL